MATSRLILKKKKKKSIKLDSGTFSLLIAQQKKKINKSCLRACCSNEKLGYTCSIASISSSVFTESHSATIQNNDRNENTSANLKRLQHALQLLRVHLSLQAFKKKTSTACGLTAKLAWRHRPQEPAQQCNHATVTITWHPPVVTAQHQWLSADMQGRKGSLRVQRDFLHAECDQHGAHHLSLPAVYLSLPVITLTPSFPA